MCVFDSMEKLKEKINEILENEASDLDSVEGLLQTLFIIKGTEIPFSITPPQSAKLIIKE